MIYFYCQSYQAFNLALSINLKERVTVITSVDNIKKACDFLYVPYIIHDDFLNFSLLTKHKSVKLQIKNLLQIIGEDELHFSHTQYALFCFILIIEAVRDNKKVVFHNFEFYYSRLKFIPLSSRNNILLAFKYILIKYLYNLPLKLGTSNPGTYMICLDMKDKILKSVELVNDKETYFDLTLEFFKIIKLREKEINLMFIAQFDDETFFYKKKISEVLNLLDEEYVSLKMHPKLKYIPELKNCRVLPTFLPVEYFFNITKGIVISIHSTSLITASKFENIKVISVLDIVGRNSVFLKQVKQHLQDNSNHRILFPSNLKELQELIS